MADAELNWFSTQSALKASPGKKGDPPKKGGGSQKGSRLSGDIWGGSFGFGGFGESFFGVSGRGRASKVPLEGLPGRGFGAAFGFWGMLRSGEGGGGSANCNCEEDWQVGFRV